MYPLRVITYNVRYFGHATRGLATQERMIRTVARAVARLNGGCPDIVALQEIDTLSLRADLGRAQARKDSRPQLQRFLDLFHQELEASEQADTYRAFFFPAHAYRLNRSTNLYTTGLAILAREDILALDDNTVDPFDITHRRIQRLARWKQTRICGHVRFVHRNGAHLDVFNTHLSLPSFLTKTFWSSNRRLGYGENQLQEAKRLIAFVQETREPDGSTLIMGDFNSLPRSPVYRYLTEEVGLHDALRHHYCLDPPDSHDYPTAGIMNMRLPIDYLFSLGRVEWLDFDETHTFGSHGGRFSGLSDHVPLVARCKLPDPHKQAASSL